MVNKDPKTIVLEFYKSFDNKDIEQAFTFLAENFIAHMAGIPEAMDRENFQKFGMKFYSAFSESQHKFQEVIVAENKVVTCGTFSAKHSGDFQVLPPTGKQIEISIMHIDRVENGKIVEHWGHGDTQGLMQQLGFILLPNPKLLPGIAMNAWEKF